MGISCQFSAFIRGKDSCQEMCPPLDKKEACQIYFPYSRNFMKDILKKKKKQNSSTEPDKYISVQIHKTNPNCQPDLGLLRNQNTSHGIWLESHRHYLALRTFLYKNVILIRQISQCCASLWWLLWPAMHRQAEYWFGTSGPTPQDCKRVIRAHPKIITGK